MLSKEDINQFSILKPSKITFFNWCNCWQLNRKSNTLTINIIKSSLPIILVIGFLKANGHELKIEMKLSCSHLSIYIYISMSMSI